jgi:hypothetical protein
VPRSPADACPPVPSSLRAVDHLEAYSHAAHPTASSDATGGPFSAGRPAQGHRLVPPLRRLRPPPLRDLRPLRVLCTHASLCTERASDLLKSHTSREDPCDPLRAANPAPASATANPGAQSGRRGLRSVPSRGGHARTTSVRRSVVCV